MQYETIILEMMSRIQKLEEEVEHLKQIVTANDFEQPDNHIKRNVKVTPEMTRLCYEKAKDAYNNQHLDTNDLAQDVSDRTGMNFNTAKMNIYSIVQMLKGEEYKRLLSADSLDLCFDMIYKEFGKQGLENALTATKLHIDYLKTKDMATVKLLSVYDRYKKIIK